MNQPLPPIPPRMQKLPLDHRGFPIPWFVAALDDGSRDFRVADGRKAEDAFRRRLCWVCGEQLGRFASFVIGPMCVVNRTTSEPPCHFDCATFSVRACPFLTRPRMRRNEKDLPPDHSAPAGVFLQRNPGVACVYTTRRYERFYAGNGYLVRLHEPVSVFWYAQGQPATRAQVTESIDSGYPLLAELAEDEGPEAVLALHEAREMVNRLLPA